jgi:hypothetical protein
MMKFLAIVVDYNFVWIIAFLRSFYFNSKQSSQAIEFKLETYKLLSWRVVFSVFVSDNHQVSWAEQLIKWIM